jgi:hypothetical protein
LAARQVSKIYLILRYDKLLCYFNINKNQAYCSLTREIRRILNRKCINISGSPALVVALAGRGILAHALTYQAISRWPLSPPCVVSSNSISSEAMQPRLLLMAKRVQNDVDFDASSGMLPKTPSFFPRDLLPHSCVWADFLKVTPPQQQHKMARFNLKSRLATQSACQCGPTLHLATLVLTY